MKKELTWRKTLIKDKDIKWEQVRKTIKDGKLDLDIHLPLTQLFEWQARTSYLIGLYDMMMFHVNKQADNKQIDSGDIVKLFEDAGYPEVAAKFKFKQDDAAK